MLTLDQQTAIAEFVRHRHLCRGVGINEEYCSMSAINKVLSGWRTDAIPAGMSAVIGRWMIIIQDAIPDAMRNSARWKSLIPLAAGTGREKETERLAIIFDWMWGTVLPAMQPIADKNRFGDAWKKMTLKRSYAAAHAAAHAADAADAAHAADAADAADAAYAAADAADAAHAADAASYTAYAASYTADDNQDSWNSFDPCGLLQRLINARKGRRRNEKNL